MSGQVVSTKRIVGADGKFITVTVCRYPTANPHGPKWSINTYELYTSTWNGQTREFLSASKAWSWARTGKFTFNKEEVTNEQNSKSPSIFED